MTAADRDYLADRYPRQMTEQKVGAIGGLPTLRWAVRAGMQTAKS